MKRITLPVLRDTASAREAWDALRRHRVHGLVAQSGAEFLLYDADDIADAMRRDTRLTLQQVRAHSIRALAGDQHSDEQSLLQFFVDNENETVVMSAADRLLFADLLHLFARPDSPIARVDAKAWRCPEDPNEVSTMQLHCNVHGVDYIEDK